MKENKFSYAYTAPTDKERREIDSIRRYYQPKSKEESKLEMLKRLDSRVKSIPQIVSLVLGVVGLLIFGLGLTFILEWNIMPLGIVLIVVSIPPIAIAYPVHNYLLNKGKEKYGQKILELSEELLNK